MGLSRHGRPLAVGATRTANHADANTHTHHFQKRSGSGTPCEYLTLSIASIGRCRVLFIFELPPRRGLEALASLEASVLP